MATKIPCEKCGRIMDPRGLSKHQPLCKGPGTSTFKCPVCGKGHKSEHSLHCHEAHTGHGEGARVKAEPADGPQCAVCGRRFTSKQGLGAHMGQSGHGSGRGVAIVSAAGGKASFGRPEWAAATPPAAAKPQRKYTRRSSAVSPPPCSGFQVPSSAVSSAPPDGIAAAGHAATRLIQLVGLGEVLADFPHPDGHCFVNTQTGKAAIITPQGEIRAAEVTMQ